MGMNMNMNIKTLTWQINIDMNMLPQCLKCRKNTEIENPKVVKNG